MGAVDAVAQHAKDFILGCKISACLKRNGGARDRAEQKIPTRNHSCPHNARQIAKIRLAAILVKDGIAGQFVNVIRAHDNAGLNMIIRATQPLAAHCLN
jgi:hypothetical protein